MSALQLLSHGRGLTQRFGAGKVLVTCALGCLFPLAAGGFCCCGLLLTMVEWR